MAPKCHHNLSPSNAIHHCQSWYCKSVTPQVKCEIFNMKEQSQLPYMADSYWQRVHVTQLRDCPVCCSRAFLEMKMLKVSMKYWQQNREEDAVLYCWSMFTSLSPNLKFLLQMSRQDGYDRTPHSCLRRRLLERHWNNCDPRKQEFMQWVAKTITTGPRTIVEVQMTVKEYGDDMYLNIHLRRM